MSENPWDIPIFYDANDMERSVKTLMYLEEREKKRLEEAKKKGFKSVSEYEKYRERLKKRRQKRKR